MIYIYIMQTIYLVHIMGKIMLPLGAEQEGWINFLNAAMNSYLHKNQGSKEEELDKFKKCFNAGDQVSLYLTDMHEPEGAKDSRRYELVAVNSNGRHQCFQVQCDEGFQVSGIKKVKSAELSAGSRELIEEIRAENTASPDSPRP